jgi:hypothetical protein
MAASTVTHFGPFQRYAKFVKVYPQPICRQNLTIPARSQSAEPTLPSNTVALIPVPLPCRNCAAPQERQNRTVYYWSQHPQKDGGSSLVSRREGQFIVLVLTIRGVYMHISTP